MSDRRISEHTHAAFDVDLRGLRSQLTEMGGLVEKAIADAVSALVKRDIDLAKEVVALDAKIDLLQREIEEKAIIIIARRQPMAVDLREIMSVFHITSDLERIGDLAKNIGKRARLIDEVPLPQVVRRIMTLSGLVLDQLKRALDSYVRHDAVTALNVWKGDEEIDALHSSLFRELLTYMMEDPRNITFCTQLLFCSKNIERMGDHATNIAGSIHYMVTGQRMTDQRPKGDTSGLVVSLRE